MKSRILHICSLIVGGCAWLFAIATLLALVLVLAISWNEPDGVSRIMAVGDGVNIKSAYGLTYRGRVGHLISIVQAVLIIAALWGSTSHVSLIRRPGLIVLTIWAVLWTANAFYVFPQGEFGLVPATLFFFVCTLARTVTRWSVNKKSS